MFSRKSPPIFSPAHCLASFANRGGGHVWWDYFGYFQELVDDDRARNIWLRYSKLIYPRGQEAVKDGERLNVGGNIVRLCGKRYFLQVGSEPLKLFLSCIYFSLKRSSWQLKHMHIYMHVIGNWSSSSYPLRRCRFFSLYLSCKHWRRVVLFVSSDTKLEESDTK